jgi:hypothetical protein
MRLAKPVAHRAEGRDDPRLVLWILEQERRLFAAVADKAW